MKELRFGRRAMALVAGLAALSVCSAIWAVKGDDPVAAWTPAAGQGAVRPSSVPTGAAEVGPRARRVVTRAAEAGAAEAGFTDSFGAAVDADPQYGLNDSLTTRQAQTAGVTYTRTSGVWYSAPPPRPWFSQVNHPDHRGTLTFFLGTSAVRMDAPVIPGGDGKVSVSATVDPVTGDTKAGGWSSLVLSRDRAASGYVTNSDVAIGALVKSNGAVQAFQNGTLLVSQAAFAQPAADGSFRLTISYAPGGRSAEVIVNGTAVTVPTPTALPATGTLFTGAYLSSDSQTSSVKDLAVSAVDRESLSLPATSGLRYYGYFAARMTKESHVPEVAGRSNLSWVNISDFDAYRPEALDACGPHSCALYTGNEFFRCATTRSCHLYPDYESRWARLAGYARPRLDKIGAFYILDEPQYKGATPQEIDTTAALIKKTFPGAKVMMIEAAPTVTPSLKVPASVDWVGFDLYCRPMDQVEEKLRTLESVTGTAQRLFLVPESAPIQACAGTAGHQSDADIAALQWEYLQLAGRHSRVIGLLNFGFWTGTPWNGGHGAADLPRTVDAHERIAARVLSAAAG